MRKLALFDINLTELALFVINLWTRDEVRKEGMKVPIHLFPLYGHAMWVCYVGMLCGHAIWASHVGMPCGHPMWACRVGISRGHVMKVYICGPKDFYCRLCHYLFSYLSPSLMCVSLCHSCACVCVFLKKNNFCTKFQILSHCTSTFSLV